MYSFHGPLKKMQSERLIDGRVRYTLELGNDLLFLNPLIGRSFVMDYSSQIECFCGKTVDRVYRQNFCYDCFFSKPQAGEAILRPELSKAHLGEEDRDLEWEKDYQLRPHVVYLANSGGLKVGVTREEQIPTRWIDQGASAAIVLAETPNRYLAGVIEVSLKEHLSDKTHVKRMLNSHEEEVDLKTEKERVKTLLPDEFQEYLSARNDIYNLHFPQAEDFTHKQSLQLEKQAKIEAKLMGIRGQYWLLDNGRAINIRSHEGRIISLEWN
jgi:hypothetical protein